MTAGNIQSRDVVIEHAFQWQFPSLTATQRKEEEEDEGGKNFPFIFLSNLFDIQPNDLFANDFYRCIKVEMVEIQ